ncbi:MAG: hypothetical protein AB1630_05435 [bacterium]
MEWSELTTTDIVYIILFWLFGSLITGVIEGIREERKKSKDRRDL